MAAKVGKGPGSINKIKLRATVHLKLRSEVIVGLFPASAMAEMRSCPFWDVTRHILVSSDVSGQPSGPILKDQAVQEDENDRMSRNVAK